MSKYLIFSDLCADEATLLAALAELGFEADRLERGTDLPLYDYHGARRPETADLVIRRHHLLSASNDIGFARTPNGLVPIISEYDQRRLRVGGKPFPLALKLAVNTRKAEQIVRRFGGSVTRRHTNGTLVITATR